MTGLNQRGIAQLLVIIILLGGFAAGLILIKNPTFFNPKASTGINVTFVDTSGNQISTTTTAQVFVKLTSPGWSQQSSLFPKEALAQSNDSCGIPQRSPNGSICLGEGCRSDEDCRTGYCCTGQQCGSNRYKCTNKDGSIPPPTATPVPGTGATDSCGLPQRSPNGNVCLGQRCRSDEDCRTGYCCTGSGCGEKRYKCTNADGSLTPPAAPSLPSSTPAPSPLPTTTSVILAEDPNFTINNLETSFTTDPIPYTFSDPSLGVKTLYVKFISSAGSTKNANPFPATIQLISEPQQAPQANPHVYILEYDDNSPSGIEVDLNFNKVTKSFYQKYPDKDDYDFLAIFPTFSWSGEAATFAAGTYTTVSNNVRGICKAVTKAYEEDWGSEKLQGFHLYPSNLGEHILKDPFSFNLVLLEETGHQWLTNIGKKNNSWPPGQPPDGVNPSCLQTDVPLLLSDDLHWSKGLVMPYDTFGGVREARPWRDNGDGTFSYDPETEEVQHKFHPFDLYLMGLMDRSEVQGEFSLLTEMEDPYQGFGFPPGGGIQPNPKNNFPTTRAKVIKLTIDDIINIAGEERKPGVSESQKDFKLAFVILLKKGEFSSETMVQGITAAANIFPESWAYATDYRSIINK